MVMRVHRVVMVVCVHRVVMVVGAGRGPLVRRAIIAASQADRNIKLYAVEKNPNAVLTLHAWKEMEWADKVPSCGLNMSTTRRTTVTEIRIWDFIYYRCVVT